MGCTPVLQHLQVAGLLIALMCGCGEGDQRTTTVSSAEPSLSLSVSEDSPEPSILAWESVDDLPDSIAVFDHVFWEPDDTNSLRELIRSADLVNDKSVLEIGTGSGLISLCCLNRGARRVVATDINPHAVDNAKYNAEHLGFSERLDVRLVPRRDPGAWTVIRPDEKFDVIISNPPWEDGKPTQLSDFALYDPDFALMKSLLDGIDQHLKPGGRVLLAYGCVTAVRLLKSESEQRGLSFKIHDNRSLDELEEVFLPGMLLEITRTTELESDNISE